MAIASQICSKNNSKMVIPDSIGDAETDITWKSERSTAEGADTDLPIYRQAKDEYAKLMKNARATNVMITESAPAR